MRACLFRGCGSYLASSRRSSRPQRPGELDRPDTAQIEKPSTGVVATYKGLFGATVQQLTKESRRQRQASGLALVSTPPAAVRFKATRCRLAASCISPRRIKSMRSTHAPPASSGTTRSAEAAGGIQDRKSRRARTRQELSTSHNDCHKPVALDIKTGAGEMGEGVLLAREDVLRLQIRSRGSSRNKLIWTAETIWDVRPPTSKPGPGEGELDLALEARRRRKENPVSNLAHLDRQAGGGMTSSRSPSDPE